jgi:hypothetical protein
MVVGSSPQESIYSAIEVDAIKPKISQTIPAVRSIIGVGDQKTAAIAAIWIICRNPADLPVDRMAVFFNCLVISLGSFQNFSQ